MEKRYRFFCHACNANGILDCLIEKCFWCDRYEGVDCIHISDDAADALQYSMKLYADGIEVKDNATFWKMATDLALDFSRLRSETIPVVATGESSPLWPNVSCDLSDVPLKLTTENMIEVEMENHLREMDGMKVRKLEEETATSLTFVVDIDPAVAADTHANIEKEIEDMLIEKFQVPFLQDQTLAIEQRWVTAVAQLYNAGTLLGYEGGSLERFVHDELVRAATSFEEPEMTQREINLAIRLGKARFERGIY